VNNIIEGLKIDKIFDVLIFKSVQIRVEATTQPIILSINLPMKRALPGAGGGGAGGEWCEGC